MIESLRKLSTVKERGNQEELSIRTLDDVLKNKSHALSRLSKQTGLTGTELKDS